MKEVEVKVQIEDFKALKSVLLDRGCTFSDLVVQEDAIYTDKETAKKFDVPVTDTNFNRIRKASNGKIFFTLKRSVSSELDCIEREVEISDANQMHDILELMGDVKVVNVKKSRQITKCDGYELSLDEVEGLGTFLEVEAMVDMDCDGQKVQEEIWKFLSELGVSRENEVTRGYDTLIYLKNK